MFFIAANSIEQLTGINAMTNVRTLVGLFLVSVVILPKSTVQLRGRMQRVGEGRSKVQTASVNRLCLNGGKLLNDGTCYCTSQYYGLSCEYHNLFKRYSSTYTTSKTSHGNAGKHCVTTEQLTTRGLLYHQ